MIIHTLHDYLKLSYRTYTAEKIYLITYLYFIKETEELFGQMSQKRYHTAEHAQEPYISIY